MLRRIAGVIALGLIACGKSTAPADAGAEAKAGASAEAKAPAAPLDLPGVDAGNMTPREQGDLQKALDTILAPCPEVAVPIGQCIREKRACPSCGRAARFVELLTRQGMPAQLIAHMVKNRYDPSAVHKLPTEGVPSKGDANAAVTIVELASFGCSHCVAEAPMLDALVAEHPGVVRLVFYSVGQGTAEAAGKASLAAANQGKYWEMHDLLFARSGNFEEADLLANAKALKLDLKKFDKDRTSQDVATKLDIGRAIFDKLGLRQTPSIFVNGRLVAGVETKEWVEEEIAALK